MANPIIRPKDLPRVTALTAGDSVVIDGASSVRSIAIEGLFSGLITLATDARFGCVGDGTTLNDTAIAAAVTYCIANGRTLAFPDGVYKHSGTLNWAFGKLHVVAFGDNVVFLHSGTGVAHSFSGIANYPASQGCVGGVFGGPGRIMLKGNPAGGTTRGVNVDNWHTGYMKVAIRDCTDALFCADSGIVGASAVCTTFDIRVSNNTDGAFAVQPNHGINGTKIVACTFEKPIIEGCGANGNVQVSLTGCINNTFRGGTIESGADGGIFEDSTSSRNTYLNLEIETNGTGCDWTLNGQHPVLINCSGAGTTAGNIFGSTGATLHGGTFQSLVNNDDTLWSSATEFLTAFTNNGIHTTVVNPQGSAGVSALEAASSILGNKIINTSNAVTLRINGKQVTDLSGTGTVLATTVSPVFTTPALGTPSAVVLTGATGLPLTTGVTGNLPAGNGGTGATAVTGTGNNVLSTSPILITPILGTPTSGTLTNCTGLPVATGVGGLGSGVATFLATPSSANLAAALTDEDGTGVVPLETQNAWTPTDQSGAALTFTAINCKYTRIGNMIHAYGTFTFPTTASGATALIGGLPFTVPNQSYAALPQPIKTSSGSGGALVAVVVQNTANFNIWGNGTSSNTVNSNFSNITISVNISYPAT